MSLTRTMRHGRGFTLVEALVSMFIFAWIALGSYQILDQIVRAQQQSERFSARLALQQRLGWQLSRDFRQMVDRQIVDEFGEPRDAIEIETDENLIEFTRTGWSNPLQWPRSELQRVAYRIDYHPESDDPDSEFYGDEALYLVRVFWQVLDRAATSKPIEQALLRDVADFRTRFYDAGAEDWSDEIVLVASESTGEEPELPGAVEVSIVLESDAVYSYIFKVR